MGFSISKKHSHEGSERHRKTFTFLFSECESLCTPNWGAREIKFRINFAEHRPLYLTCLISDYYFRHNSTNRVLLRIYLKTKIVERSVWFSEIDLDKVKDYFSLGVGALVGIVFTIATCCIGCVVVACVCRKRRKYRGHVTRQPSADTGSGGEAAPLSPPPAATPATTTPAPPAAQTAPHPPPVQPYTGTY